MCNGIFELKRQPYLLFQYPFCNKIKVLYIRVIHIVLRTYVLMLTNTSLKMAALPHARWFVKHPTCHFGFCCKPYAISTIDTLRYCYGNTAFGKRCLKEMAQQC